MNAATRVMVVVVEDDDDCRAVFLEMLEEVGYVVADVTTASAARCYLRKAAADCVVLLDYRLPGENGATLLRAALREERLRRHRYVLVTAADMKRIPAEDRQLVDIYCAEIIRKPFEMDTLLRALAQAGPQPSCSPR